MRVHSYVFRAVLIVGLLLGAPLWAQEQQSAPPDDPLKLVLGADEQVFTLVGDDTVAKGDTIFATFFAALKEKVKAIHEKEALCGSMTVKLKMKFSSRGVDVVIAREDGSLALNNFGWGLPIDPNPKDCAGTAKVLTEKIATWLPYCREPTP